VDPEFNNTEEWYQSIPSSIRPIKEQPFYHLFAENGEIFYIAYVSEQNLLEDESKDLPKHPEIKNLFSHFENGKFMPVPRAVN
jgi:heat shock protein HspQ